jgi:hypothetical protein
MQVGGEPAPFNFTVHMNEFWLRFSLKILTDISLQNDILLSYVCLTSSHILALKSAVMCVLRYLFCHWQEP